jgi:hypothetical protein
MSDFPGAWNHANRLSDGSIYQTELLRLPGLNEKETNAI